jgi:hypothetical protein
MIYVIQVYRQLSSSSRIRMELVYVEFHFQNKFEKLVHLVGFIIRKFVTMHGHVSRCTVT